MESSKKVKKTVFKDGETLRKRTSANFKVEKDSDEDELADDKATSKDHLKKYVRNKTLNLDEIVGKVEKVKYASKESKIHKAAVVAARREGLLTEKQGFIQPEDNEVSVQFTQSDIQESVDQISACKRFDLDLRSFGPYRMNYIKNGRFLLLGGRRGHVAALDWITKKLLCEVNVMEGVYDVSWLHQETLFAVAQKKWVYIYDNQGIEIHCLKKLYNVIKLEFLPYHFLLSTVSSNGFISWLDVSIGEMVSQCRINSRGVAATIAQNPANAHIAIGEPTGVVSFWSPNSNKAAVSKWCHKQPIAAIAFDPKGTIFATCGMEKSLKIWDARNLQGPTEEIYVHTTPRSMCYSHRGVLALGFGNIVQVMNEGSPYLRHQVGGSICNLQFCPYEDVLGVGHCSGFSSLLVPGSAEPNYDALEANPFQSKTQRRETEVKALLNKIPSTLISWDPRELESVHIPSLESIIEAKKKLLHVKPPNIKYTPKKKTGKAAKNTLKRKMIVVEGMRKRYFDEVKQQQQEELEEVHETPQRKGPESVLDRFKPKKKNK